MLTIPVQLLSSKLKKFTLLASLLLAGILGVMPVMAEDPTPVVITISPPEQVRIRDFGRLFSGVVAFLLLVAFILAFFFLILGGISWLTSGGDKSAVEAARNKIIAALVGLVIVAATWALFQLVGGAIGFNILGGFEIPTLF